MRVIFTQPRVLRQKGKEGISSTLYKASKEPQNVPDEQANNWFFRAQVKSGDLIMSAKLPDATGKVITPKSTGGSRG